ncbi:hypothetical protein PTKIN_Ptkin09bG0110700 [Pterospermum kingtungense]
MAKEVMKTHGLDICSRPVLRGMQKLSYNGLDIAFSPYNACWREIRKICVVHLFNSYRVQIYRPIREDEVACRIQKISKSSADSKPVNLSEAMMCLTSTIICKVGFCKRYEDEGTERSRFHELLNESEALLATFCLSDYFPSMGWVDRFFGFLSRLERNFKKFDAFYQELIDEHLDPKRLKLEQEDIVIVLSQIWKDGQFTTELKTWDNPEEFYPERFIGSSIDHKGLDFELIPFGAGRRGCPGIHMGVATIELVLANIVYKFDWELPTGMNKEDVDFDVKPGLTVHKRNALCLAASNFLFEYQSINVAIVVLNIVNS